ncbi:unnamed protein product [Adineta steineri]|uniref:PX domain-containing protein n=1 Tax=Adineta steineri TaxID=433720 RepID=A0A818HY05_9BILA|nr:unnamed protein product [Adineta steineri]CAF3516096.1 unnamed protein product [Adineta steineri]
MSDDNDQLNAPPDDFGLDDDTKADESLFVSALSPATVDIALSGEEDDEDENPFGDQPPREKTATNTTNIVESAVDNEKNSDQSEKAMTNIDEDDDDIFGVKTTSTNAPLLTTAPSQISVTEPTPPSLPPASTSTSANKENTMFDIDSDVKSPTPVRSIPSYDSQISSSTPISKNVLSGTVTTNQPAQKRADHLDIEITVGDPAKVGSGMSSYMTYRITTKTTLSMFKKSEFSVNRRFSDFLGLHAKVVHKHLHSGIIIPSPPEKDSLSMAKVKMSSKEEAVPTDFIDRRRGLLERYLNRLVQNSKLVEDSDVRDFLEISTDLPKSTNTQALSGAGVLRAVTNISNTVTKLGAKTSEQDQWFEEKHNAVLDLHGDLKHIYNHFNTLFSQRKEAGHSLKQFSAAINHLATTEEYTLLSSALIELANLEEKIEQINNEQSLKEYTTITELIKEYVSLLDMVQLAFHERIKIHQQWLHAEDTLKQKRETKTKLEQTPKGADKLPRAEMEIQEWEGKVERGKESFESISSTIKQEMEAFEETRIDDFKKAFNNHLKNALDEQEKILQIWEAYLPEVNKINI